MKVNEIFLSINGEINSEFPGSLTVFIRLGGCNLRCKYCDTKYAQEKGDEISLTGIVKMVQAFGCPRVTITGGEPLQQFFGLQRLIPLLLDSGIEKVVIETNGSYTPPDFLLDWTRISWVMDYKLPSSGMESWMGIRPFLRLGNYDWIKFVIEDQEDFDRATTMMGIMREVGVKGRFAMSPSFRLLPPSQLVNWIQQGELWDVVVSLQLHKMIGLK